MYILVYSYVDIYSDELFSPLQTKTLEGKNECEQLTRESRVVGRRRAIPA